MIDLNSVLLNLQMVCYFCFCLPAEFKGIVSERHFLCRVLSDMFLESGGMGSVQEAKKSKRKQQEGTKLY